MRISKVYTRQGDDGDTRLAGGQAVPKTHPRIEAYGGVDELNACVGLVAEACRAAGGDALADLRERLVRVQHDLFDLGASLAVLPEDRRDDTPAVSAEDTAELEREMDAWNENLPALKDFILPGGGTVSAHLHLARTVCRRVERDVLRLHAEDPQPAETLAWLNRLSDWLFVAGRAAARAEGCAETLWREDRRPS